MSTQVRVYRDNVPARTGAEIDFAARIQEFEYHDLGILVVDWDRSSEAPSDSPDAELFYSWNGASETEVENALAAGTWHTTMVVNRMSTNDKESVAALFDELDSTGFPHDMGTRRRQLWMKDGIYFHLQDFAQAEGNQIIDQAWRDSDPRFIKVCDDLENHIRRYDESTWTVPADSIARRTSLTTRTNA